MILQRQENKAKHLKGTQHLSHQTSLLVVNTYNVKEYNRQMNKLHCIMIYICVCGNPAELIIQGS
jgi:hypothetical protein